MAIYHYSARIIKRSDGRSSVASAAYRAGERLRDERTMRLYDYRHRREFIESFIEAPDGAPGWVTSRGDLWNTVEGVERRKDAQLSREVEVALPVELTREQQTELVRGFVQEEYVSRGMVADVNIHRHDNGNPHAHIMLSMRGISPDGFVSKKERAWNAPELHGRWREAWASHTNEHLREAGREERVDHRSNRERGITKEPTRHDGPNVRAMEGRGLRADRADENRAVHRRNEERARQLENARRDPLAARFEEGYRRRRDPARDHHDPDLDREL